MSHRGTSFEFVYLGTEHPYFEDTEFVLAQQESDPIRHRTVWSGYIHFSKRKYQALLECMYPDLVLFPAKRYTDAAYHKYMDRSRRIPNGLTLRCGTPPRPGPVRPCPAPGPAPPKVQPVTRHPQNKNKKRTENNV